MKKQKKVIYKLQYTDIAERDCVREYKAECIVSVMREIKKFVCVNRISDGKVVTPSGKVYHV